MTWRAFIGEEGWRTVEDQRGLTWQQARDVLLAFAHQSVDDNTGGCLTCEARSRDAVRGLTQLAEDTEWDGDIDRDDLRLTWETS